jgi:hypothetical protein
MGIQLYSIVPDINLLNAKLNPICHLLALLGAHHILHVSRIRVKAFLDSRYRPIISGMSTAVYET